MRQRGGEEGRAKEKGKGKGAKGEKRERGVQLTLRLQASLSW
jgi:hypothetical protein